MLAVNERIAGEAIGHTSSVSHQLVRERSAHAFDEQRIIRVLQHAAVALLLDVLQILARAARRGIPLTHVAQPSRELGKSLPIRAVTDPVDGQAGGLGELRRERTVILGSV